MKWSTEQNEALREVNKWITDYYTSHSSQKKQVFYLAGYAGTGKTTLAAHFAANLNGPTFFGAYTGKAALMMKKKGCANASTIHRMIYIPVEDPKTKETYFRLWTIDNPLDSAKLIVIDECSMVDEEIGKDLMSFGIPILVLGDPAQLPPIAGAGFFTKRKPDFMLTEIHRQAADSPIIYLATMARNKQIPPLGTYGNCIISDKVSSETVGNAEQVLVGTNATRTRMNERIRKILFIDSFDPVESDRLICLKNDYQLGILNGEMFVVDKIFPKSFKGSDFWSMSVTSDDTLQTTLVNVHKSHFDSHIEPLPKTVKKKDNQDFTFGYAITTHKAQGSQWDSVLIYDESRFFRENSFEWLYTAITRAADKLIMIRK